MANRAIVIFEGENSEYWTFSGFARRGFDCELVDQITQKKLTDMKNLKEKFA
jgi:hypothetical protein